MLDLILPDGGTTLIRDGVPLHLSMRGLVERRLSVRAQNLVERIHDPVVMIDRDIAMVWAPFQIFRDGEPFRVGTNIISLFRRDGRWLMSGVADYNLPVA